MQPLANPKLDWRVSDLRAACPGLAVEVVDRIGSTNTQLLDACRADTSPLQQPLLLVAERQFGGRGRLGRAWTSAPGASLTASLAWPLRRADLSGLSLAVGVALAEALEPAPPGGRRIGLKWPNDLWLLSDDDASGRKLGGILIEAVSQALSGRAVVIGFGLNVRPLDVPDARTGVACLHEIDPTLDAPAALHRITAPLLRALAAFDRDGFAPLEARYRARDLLRGRTIDAGGHTGEAAGVAADGALLLRDAAQVHRIVSGEVSVRLLPRATPAPTPC